MKILSFIISLFILSTINVASNNIDLESTIKQKKLLSLLSGGVYTLLNFGIPGYVNISESGSSIGGFEYEISTNPKNGETEIFFSTDPMIVFKFDPKDGNKYMDMYIGGNYEGQSKIANKNAQLVFEKMIAANCEGDNYIENLHECSSKDPEIERACRSSMNFLKEAGFNVEWRDGDVTRYFSTIKNGAYAYNCGYTEQIRIYQIYTDNRFRVWLPVSADLKKGLCIQLDGSSRETSSYDCY